MLTLHFPLPPYRVGQSRGRQVVQPSVGARGSCSAGIRRVTEGRPGVTHAVHQVRSDGEEDGRNQGALQGYG